MKRVLKPLLIVIASIFVCFIFIYLLLFFGVWFIENSCLPQHSLSVPHSASEYINKFDVNSMDEYNVYRWGYEKPDFRISGNLRLYGYEKDDSHIYAFSTLYSKMLYRGDNGYPDFTVNPIEKVVLSHWNNGDFQTNSDGMLAFVYDFTDAEVFEWITASEEISKLSDFIKNASDNKMVAIDAVEGHSYIRVIYKDSPIYEIVGRLIKTTKSEYFIVPYGSNSYHDKFGIPFDISKFSTFPEDFFWYGNN